MVALGERALILALALTASQQQGAEARPLALQEPGAVAGDSCSVSLRVLSGAPPPVWRAPHAVASAALAPADDSATQPQESAAVGYAGFDVTCGTQRTRVFGARAVEEALLASAPAGLLAPQVERHVAARIAAGPGPALAPSQQALLPSPASPNCTVPIRGPADWEAVKYAPQTDDCGCFSGDNTPANNCYAYGTDVCTNTFPQPGRGSGQKWSEDTCDDIRASSERDGLVWAGTDLPKTGPEDGESHYVSLHIWDKTNFHWLRMDNVVDEATGMYMWSHKPGQTPVRNVDNNGDIITDPAKADVSPWSIHCGYMLAAPQKVTIN